MKIDKKNIPLYRLFDGEFLYCPKCGDSEGEWEEEVGDWSKCANCGHSRIYPLPKIFPNLYRA